MLGITQQALAEDLGVTFQQVQKYEIGANRVSASRLWTLARLLGVPVEFFFEGLAPAQAPAPDHPSSAAGASDPRRRRRGPRRTKLNGAGTPAGTEAGPGQGRAEGATPDKADPERNPDTVAASDLAALTFDRDAALLLRSFCATPVNQRRRLLDLARALSRPTS